VGVTAGMSFGPASVSISAGRSFGPASVSASAGMSFGPASVSSSEDRTAGLPTIEGEKGYPIKFLTLLSDVAKGPKTYGWSKKEAHSMSRRLLEKTRSENSETNSVGATAGMSFGPASVSASVSHEWGNTNSHETESEKNDASSFASKEYANMVIPDGEYMFKAAEMEMYVYKNKAGVISRVVYPTGHMYDGPHPETELTNVLLDNTFATLDKFTTETEIHTYNHAQIQRAILKQNLQIDIDAIRIDQNHYYQLENYHHPNSFLTQFTNNDIGCGKIGYNMDVANTLWRFEEDAFVSGTYNIVSKLGNKRLYNNPTVDQTGCWQENANVENPMPNINAFDKDSQFAVMEPMMACPKSPTTGSSYIIRSEEDCRAATHMMLGQVSSMAVHSYKGVDRESFPGCNFREGEYEPVFNTNTNTGRYGLQQHKMSLCYFNKDCWWGSTNGGRSKSQLWKVGHVKGNKIRLTNVKTGYDLAQWRNTGKFNCGPKELYCKKSEHQSRASDCRKHSYDEYNHENMWKLIQHSQVPRG